MKFEKQINSVVKKILQVQNLYNLDTKENILEVVKKRLSIKENNVILFFNQNKKALFFKLSISDLTGKIEKKSIRSKLNLKNEIRFYQEIKDVKFKNLIIPKYFASSKAGRSWLLISKLSPKEKIFSSKSSFFKPYPKFLIESIEKGIEDLKKVDTKKSKLRKMNCNDIIEWAVRLKPVYEKYKTFLSRKEIINFFKKWSNLWQSDLKFINHSDILSDSCGYNIDNKKLILIDFEKAQISHRAFDYPSFTKNPLFEKWNNCFEEYLFKKHSEKEFIILYKLSKLIQLMHTVNNHISKRLDFIFENIISRQELDQIRKKMVPCYGVELSKLVKFFRTNE